MASVISDMDWRVDIFKKDSRDDLVNYRAVSLTSIPGKSAESIIKYKISNHMDEYDLLRKRHHDFCKGKSLLQRFAEVI